MAFKKIKRKKKKTTSKAVIDWVKNSDQSSMFKGVKFTKDYFPRRHK